MSEPGASAFDLVIAVDWSAASVPGPRRETEDRCWLAWGWAGERVGERAGPEYWRTRSACMERVAELLEGHPDARALVGFDFPFGYPRLEDGSSVLPTGRALGALMDELLADGEDDANNRFEVAGELNRRVRSHSGAEAGPFWGHPAGRSYAELTPTRPRVRVGVGEYRRCDLLVRGELGKAIQSAWKLAYPASVGSQVITGLAAVHRLMGRGGLRERCVLWPFESWDGPPGGRSPRGEAWGRAPGGASDGRVVVSEIWPGLVAFDHVSHPIKDARQVVATRDAMMEWGLRGLAVPLRERDAWSAEGWIVGLSAALAERGGGGRRGAEV